MENKVTFIEESNKLFDDIKNNAVETFTATELIRQIEEYLEDNTFELNHKEKVKILSRLSTAKKRNELKIELKNNSRVLTLACPNCTGTDLVIDEEKINNSKGDWFICSDCMSKFKLDRCSYI